MVAQTLETASEKGPTMARTITLPPVAIDDLTWLDTPCTECHHGYYYAKPGAENAAWECSRCQHTITRDDLDPGTTGDLFLTRQHGSLRRGIHPAATYTFAWLPHGSPNPMPTNEWILTAAELSDQLTRICQWTYQETDRTISRANRNGSAEHVSGYGLRTLITRNP